MLTFIDPHTYDKVKSVDTRVVISDICEFVDAFYAIVDGERTGQLCRIPMISHLKSLAGHQSALSAVGNSSRGNSSRGAKHQRSGSAFQEETETDFVDCQIVPLLDNIVKVISNRYCVYALSKDGSIFSLGTDTIEIGILGLGRECLTALNFKRIEIADSVCEISITDTYCITLTSMGELMVWGTPVDHYFSNHSSQTHFLPTKLVLNQVCRIEKIFANPEAFFLVHDNNTIECFTQFSQEGSDTTSFSSKAKNYDSYRIASFCQGHYESISQFSKFIVLLSSYNELFIYDKYNKDVHMLDKGLNFSMTCSSKNRLLALEPNRWEIHIISSPLYHSNSFECLTHKVLALGNGDHSGLLLRQLRLSNAIMIVSETNTSSFRTPNQQTALEELGTSEQQQSRRFGPGNKKNLSIKTSAVISPSISCQPLSASSKMKLAYQSSQVKMTLESSLASPARPKTENYQINPISVQKREGSSSKKKPLELREVIDRTSKIRNISIESDNRSYDEALNKDFSNLAQKTTHQPDAPLLNPIKRIDGVSSTNDPVLSLKEYREQKRRAKQERESQKNGKDDLTDLYQRLHKKQQQTLAVNLKSKLQISHLKKLQENQEIGDPNLKLKIGSEYKEGDENDDISHRDEMTNLESSARDRLNRSHQSTSLRGHTLSHNQTDSITQMSSELQPNFKSSLCNQGKPLVEYHPIQAQSNHNSPTMLHNNPQVKPPSTDGSLKILPAADSTPKHLHHLGQLNQQSVDTFHLSADSSSVNAKSNNKFVSVASSLKVQNSSPLFRFEECGEAEVGPQEDNSREAQDQLEDQEDKIQIKECLKNSLVPEDEESNHLSVNSSLINSKNPQKTDPEENSHLRKLTNTQSIIDVSSPSINLRTLVEESKDINLGGISQQSYLEATGEISDNTLGKDYKSAKTETKEKKDNIVEFESCGNMLPREIREEIEEENINSPSGEPHILIEQNHSAQKTDRLDSESRGSYERKPVLEMENSSAPKKSPVTGRSETFSQSPNPQTQDEQTKSERNQVKVENLRKLLQVSIGKTGELMCPSKEYDENLLKNNLEAPGINRLLTPISSIQSLERRSIDRKKEPAKPLDFVQLANFSKVPQPAVVQSRQRAPSPSGLNQSSVCTQTDQLSSKKNLEISLPIGRDEELRAVSRISKNSSDSYMEYHCLKTNPCEKSKISADLIRDIERSVKSSKPSNTNLAGREYLEGRISKTSNNISDPKLEEKEKSSENIFKAPSSEQESFQRNTCSPTPQKPPLFFTKKPAPAKEFPKEAIKEPNPILLKHKKEMKSNLPYKNNINKLKALCSVDQNKKRSRSGSLASKQSRSKSKHCSTQSFNSGIGMGIGSPKSITQKSRQSHSFVSPPSGLRRPSNKTPIKNMNFYKAHSKNAAYVLSDIEAHFRRESAPIHMTHSLVETVPNPSYNQDVLPQEKSPSQYIFEEAPSKSHFMDEEKSPVQLNKPEPHQKTSSDKKSRTISTLKNSKSPAGTVNYKSPSGVSPTANALTSSPFCNRPLQPYPDRHPLPTSTTNPSNNFPSLPAQDSVPSLHTHQTHSSQPPSRLSHMSHFSHVSNYQLSKSPNKSPLDSLNPSRQPSKADLKSNCQKEGLDKAAIKQIMSPTSQLEKVVSSATIAASPLTPKSENEKKRLTFEEVQFDYKQGLQKLGTVVEDCLIYYYEWFSINLRTQAKENKLKETRRKKYEFVLLTVLDKMTEKERVGLQTGFDNIFEWSKVDKQVIFNTTSSCRSRYSSIAELKRDLRNLKTEVAQKSKSPIGSRKSLSRGGSSRSPMNSRKNVTSGKLPNSRNPKKLTRPPSYGVHSRSLLTDASIEDSRRSLDKIKKPKNLKSSNAFIVNTEEYSGEDHEDLNNQASFTFQPLKPKMDTSRDEEQVGEKTPVNPKVSSGATNSSFSTPKPTEKLQKSRSQRSQEKLEASKVVVVTPKISPPNQKTQKSPEPSQKSLKSQISQKSPITQKSSQKSLPKIQNPSPAQPSIDRTEINDSTNELDESDFTSKPVLSLPDLGFRKMYQRGAYKLTIIA